MMTPYFETDRGKLYHGDCLGVELEEKAALICIDPPYNIGKDTWDKIADYPAWMGEVFKLCERSLADNGSFYWFHNKMPVIARLMGWLEENTEFVFKQLITWNKYFNEAKNVGFCKQRLAIDESRNFYGGFTEYCLFYTFQDETGLDAILPRCFIPYLDYMTSEKSKSGLNTTQMNELCGYAAIASHWFYGAGKRQNQPRFIQPKDYAKLQGTGFFQRPYEDLRKEYEDLRYTFNNQPVTGDFRFHLQDWNNSVWNYSAAPQMGHLTPKPVRLIENILKHSSNEGDLVVDYFGGSGTTAIACENLKRRWILCEKDESSCELAAKRIEAAANQMSFEDYLD